MAAAIVREFNAAHPDIEVALKPFDPDTEDFYNPKKVVSWLNGTDAEIYDLVEVDMVLQDEVISSAESWMDVEASEDWFPAVRAAVVREGKVLAYPHMMCGHFVFTRRAEIAQAATAEELVTNIKKVSAQRKLVGDFGGSWNLPALYLDAWADTYGINGLDKAVGSKLDPRVVEMLRSIELLCHAMDDDPCVGPYHANPKLAAEAFATGEAGVFIGYSEYLATVLAKRTDSLPVLVASAPLGGGSHPVLFVDALVLRKGCVGQCQADARAFAEFLDSARGYETLLMGTDSPSGRPRYLLPATKAAFKIPAVAADPYYRAFETLIGEAGAFPTAGLYTARETMKKNLMEALKKSELAQAASPTGRPSVAKPSSPSVEILKPSPELTKLKSLEGTWKCDGTAPAGAAGPGSPRRKYKSTWKFSRELDGFWWLADYKQVQGKGAPAVIRGLGYIGYDPVARQYIVVVVDNFSAYIIETATIVTDQTGRWTFEASGDGMMVGQKISFREKFQLFGAKQFTWIGELKKNTDNDFVTAGEETCRKRAVSLESKVQTGKTDPTIAR